MAFVNKTPQERIHTQMMNKNISGEQFNKSIMPKDRYVNVAMQMMPPSMASNTASSTKA